MLTQMLLDVRCEELFYYAASTAVLRSSINFGVNRYFTETYLPYLIRAAATLPDLSFMLRRTRLLLLCRTWCVRGCRLSAGFISPHFVYAVCPNLRAFTSPHLLRTHVQPQLFALDTVTVRYVLCCSLVRAFCHTSCGLRIPYLHDMFLLAPGRASAMTISWACFADVTLDFKYRPESAGLLPSTRVYLQANALLAPRSNDGSMHSCRCCLV